MCAQDLRRLALAYDLLPAPAPPDARRPGQDDRPEPGQAAPDAAKSSHSQEVA